MPTLVECVPNFSEGRDAAKVDAIVAAMKMDGVYLLDREMDADHNRCVITLVGEKDAIQEAAIRGVGKAAELIDLNVHQGAHPRLGAADVVPFIPIEGVTIEECVVMARHVGEEIWKRYQVPVYFYESAATSPERQNLENIRRGQYEGIKAEIATNPARKPDVGNLELHPSAGAVVVGARKFLVAYNIFLNTPDVDIAKKVAKAVRFSSGGLKFVKAAGFLVRGLAQVSMNLTDFEQTSMSTVFEAVRAEAAKYGVTPLSSEIIGLVPKKALEQVAAHFLQVENFDSSLILENRLAAVMSKPLSNRLSSGIDSFLTQLAAPTATPGGGSAAAASGAMAAGLAHMVATMSKGKKSYVQYDTELAEAISRLAVLQAELTASIDADADSYKDVMKAYKAHKEANKSPESGIAIRNALRKAAEVPLSVAQKSAEAGRIAKSLLPKTNPNMGPDLKTASALARAAIEGAIANVQVNLQSMKEFVGDSASFDAEKTFIENITRLVKEVKVEDL